MSNEQLLHATSLKKTYQIGKRRLEVLQGVDLKVNAGEFVALRGASGAGKSTLLHLLGGLDKPDEGEIKFRNRPLHWMATNELALFRGRNVGFIFQSYHLLQEFDALENVCLSARIRRRPANEVRKQATELLERVGLDHRLDHRPNELSGGEQQRVAIARALINEPALIVADEPTGNLDSKTGGEILDLLCSLREEHKTTLIIATHDSSVAGIAPRVVQLADGKLAATPPDLSP
ncbi:MAG: ABC transporter [Verrucomicrobiales bacterium]|nr:ABC transporter [Verrucomicrobiales bacterium]|tara:strand:+ start:5333 stop:6034 length:702 start_codon:yes stop_codon:yes gene_type:complete